MSSFLVALSIHFIVYSAFAYKCPALHSPISKVSPFRFKINENLPSIFCAKINPVSSKSNRLSLFLQNFLKAFSAKRNRIKSYIREETPFLQYIWPRDNLKLKFYLIASMVFMYIGKFFNVQVTWQFPIALLQ